MFFFVDSRRGCVCCWLCSKVGNGGWSVGRICTCGLVTCVSPCYDLLHLIGLVNINHHESTHPSSYPPTHPTTHPSNPTLPASVHPSIHPSSHPASQGRELLASRTFSAFLWGQCDVSRHGTHPSNENHPKNTAPANERQPINTESVSAPSCLFTLDPPDAAVGLFFFFCGHKDSCALTSFISHWCKRLLLLQRGNEREGLTVQRSAQGKWGNVMPGSARSSCAFLYNSVSSCPSVFLVEPVEVSAAFSACARSKLLTSIDETDVDQSVNSAVAFNSGSR